MMDDDDQPRQRTSTTARAHPAPGVICDVYALVQFIVLLFCLRLQQYTTQGKREENKKFQIALLS